MSGVLTRKDREKPHELGAASASTLALLRYCTAFACGLAAMFTVAWLLSLPFLIPKKEVYPGVFTEPVTIPSGSTPWSALLAELQPDPQPPPILSNPSAGQPP